jgi:serine/threonine protein phosphatase PrpC
VVHKQLQLDVAQLTDVGRRREHNEDNMAYVIPKDEQVMAQKGALFIVADGMGGHAAGEVASEIAVDTVSNAYYQDESDDVVGALLRAIKRANTLIMQRAAENMLRNGMGTTCVAAIMRGNMAYVANVGDSRAYLVRHNLVKQVSQDHSWVAEQVRAGLLTGDQARTHAQRNVITRCLGTQNDVDIDVFTEPLEQGDTLVLCSDGLSGMISDDEIRSIVGESAPQESVYHLVEKANENGGADNITAIVVTVQEVGIEPPGARHPVSAGRVKSNETGEDTAILGVSSAPTAPFPLYPDQRNGAFGNAPTSPFAPESPSVPATQPALQTSQQLQRRQPKHGRLYYPTAALLILLIVLVAGGGAYFYLNGHTPAANNAASTITNAQQLITQAQHETASNPALALNNLADAQTLLRHTLQSSGISSKDQSKALTILQGSFTQQVQQAIAKYNQQANITALNCLGPSTGTINVGTTNTQPKALALVYENGKPLFFASGTNNALYSVSTTNNSLIPYTSLPSSLAHAQILDIAGYDGTQLALLVMQPGRSSSIPDYSLVFLSPQAKKVETTIPLQPKNGEAPTLIAAWNQDIYVVLTMPSLSQITIWHYGPSTSGNHALSLNPTQSTVSVSANIVSIAAFPDQELFFLSQDGLVHSYTFATGNQAAASVLLQQAIPQPLSVSSQGYTWKTAVPTTTDGSKSLDILNPTSPSTLVAAVIQNSYFLYVMDTNLHRILALKLVNSSNSTAPSGLTPVAKLSPTATNVGGGVSVSSAPSASMLQLQQQYTSPTMLASMKSMVVDSSGTTLSVLTQSQSNAMSSLVSFNTTTQPQSNCG